MESYMSSARDNTEILPIVYIALDFNDSHQNCDVRNLSTSKVFISVELIPDRDSLSLMVVVVVVVICQE